MLLFWRLCSLFNDYFMQTVLRGFFWLFFFWGGGGGVSLGWFVLRNSLDRKFFFHVRCPMFIFGAHSQQHVARAFLTISSSCFLTLFFSSAFTRRRLMQKDVNLPASAMTRIFRKFTLETKHLPVASESQSVSSCLLHR